MGEDEDGFFKGKKRTRLKKKHIALKNG